MSDLIRREDAFKAVLGMTTYDTVDDVEIHCDASIAASEGWLGGVRDALRAIEDVPSAETERENGKWQRRKGSDCWECSQCHAVLENDDLGMHNFYFCYHCGANMMKKSGYMDLEKANYE